MLYDNDDKVLCYSVHMCAGKKNQQLLHCAVSQPAAQHLNDPSKRLTGPMIKMWKSCCWC